MKDIIIEIIYISIINVVPSTVAILVPLVGAFWIFKVREKTVAEGKIFELGREIANIFQSKEIRGPTEGVSYAYIDKARHKIDEKNREKAIKLILEENLHFHKFGREPTEDEEREAANVVVAVATERIQSLVPPTVNWSGRGIVYSPYGEDIDTKDSYFPFGTKLYREWIEKFGGIYNDIWAITTSRNFFIESFMKGYENSSVGIDRKFVDNWLDEVDTRIKEIHPLHAKLLTQIQIIDTQVDLPRLGKDIGAISFYAVLLVASGFFFPKLIYLSGQSSLISVLWLTAATALSYLLIGLRVVSAVKPVRKKHVQREIFIPRLINDLKSMEKRCMRYKPYLINDILSLDSDLMLNNRLKNTLEVLVEKIDIFNEYASILYKESEERIDLLKPDFETNRESQQGFSIKVHDLSNADFDLESIKSRVMKEDYNFTFSYDEIQSSRDLFTINLSELSKEKRLLLCEKLDSFRIYIQSLPLHKTSEIALLELQETRKDALEQVEKSYNNQRQSDA